MPSVGFIQGRAQQVDNLDTWGRFIISVTGAGAVFVATTKEALEMPGAQGIQQGAPYTQANTNPPKDVPWVGPLWVFIDAAGTIADIQIPRKRAYGAG